MDTLSAFAMGQATKGNEHKVFDWARAAQLIRNSAASEASAGLAGDWEYTGGKIFENGKPVAQDDTYVYLASTWATPEIEINGERQDCFLMVSETPGWDAETFWPPEALAILNSSSTARAE